MVRYKDIPKYTKKDNKEKFKELKLLERKASHQRAKYLKYKQLKKDFAKKNIPKEETVILDDTLGRVNNELILAKGFT